MNQSFDLTNKVAVVVGGGGHLCSVLAKALFDAGARIVILDATENPVRAINESYNVEHGQIELNDPARFGLPVKHGYIITSRRAA